MHTRSSNRSGFGRPQPRRTNENNETGRWSSSSGSDHGAGGPRRRRQEQFDTAAPPASAAPEVTAAPAAPVETVPAPIVGGTGEDGELRLWLNGGDTPDDFVKFAIGEFTKVHPDVKVTFERQQWTGIVEKLTTALSSSDSPDVIELGNTQAQAFEAAGALADLTANKAALGGDDLLQGLVEAGTYNGKFYGVPYYAGARVILYRMNLFPAKVERRGDGLAAVVAEVVIPLDPSTLIDDFFAAWIGKTITVGVRAESVTAAPRCEGSPRVTGTVEFVEELGSEVIVHASVDGLGPSLEIAIAREAATDDGEIVPTLSNLVTKLPTHSTCRPGDVVTLFIDPAGIHCFDPTGPSLHKGADL